jgi:hypothetical protein
MISGGLDVPTNDRRTEQSQKMTHFLGKTCMEAVPLYQVRLVLFPALTDEERAPSKQPGILQVRRRSRLLAGPGPDPTGRAT